MRHTRMAAVKQPLCNSGLVKITRSVPLVLYHRAHAHTRTRSVSVSPMNNFILSVRGVLSLALLGEKYIPGYTGYVASINLSTRHPYILESRESTTEIDVKI